MKEGTGLEAGVNHDVNGDACSSRIEQQSKDNQEAEGSSQSDLPEYPESEDGGSFDERELALAKVQSLIAELDNEQLEELISSKILVGLSSREWVGLLPAPDQFMQYPEDVRGHMVAWNDAQIIDASRREDKLTNAFIKSMTRDQWLSFTLNAVFTLSAFIGFIVTGDPSAFGFLAIPGINVAFNIWKSRNDKDQ